jgi:hypothetical protein
LRKVVSNVRLPPNSTTIRNSVIAESTHNYGDGQGGGEAVPPVGGEPTAAAVIVATPLFFYSYSLFIEYSFHDHAI